MTTSQPANATQSGEMRPSKKGLIFAAVGLAAVAILMRFLFGASSAQPTPSASGYYSGPMMNKSRTAIVDENGKVYQRLTPPSGNADGAGGGRLRTP